MVKINEIKILWTICAINPFTYSYFLQVFSGKLCKTPLQNYQIWMSFDRFDPCVCCVLRANSACRECKTRTGCSLCLIRERHRCQVLFDFYWVCSLRDAVHSHLFRTKGNALIYRISNNNMRSSCLSVLVECDKKHNQAIIYSNSCLCEQHRLHFSLL